MPVQTSLAVVDGRPAVVRTGAGPDGERLRREADALARLAGLAVPDVLTVADELDGAVRLVVAYHPVALLDVAALASVAATLATPHERSVVHGALDGTAVLAGGDGPIVGGWGGDPHATPADDVAALGRLADAAVPAARALAARATVPDATARPTMRAMADGLAGLAPPPAARSSPPGRGRRSTRRTGPRLAGVVAAAAALVAAALAVPTSVALRGGVGPRADQPAPASAAPDRSGAPPDADGPPLLTGAGQRWTAGQAGDVAVVADLRCAGRPAAILLRPSTGEVWAFDGWDDGAAARAVTTRPGARELRIRPQDGCDRVETVGAGGARLLP